ncbi:MAG: adenosylcobinamide-GDP ribazoletransferase [Thermomicrobiales bacterium]
MGLIAALAFLTALPVSRREASAGARARALWAFPLVGALIGGLLVVLDLALSPVLPVGPRTVLLLIALAAVTRGLHFDALMDVCDGLFGGFTPERRLAIMRDSHAGAFGVLGAALDLLLRYAALTALGGHWRVAGLLLPAIAGRWAMTIAIVAFPYARPEGLGRAFKDAAGWRNVAGAALVAMALATVAWWPGGAAVLLLALLALLLGAWFMLRRLPGLTGDCYGALNELVEGVVLVAIVVAQALVIGGQR